MIYLSIYLSFYVFLFRPFIPLSIYLKDMILSNVQVSRGID